MVREAVEYASHLTMDPDVAKRVKKVLMKKSVL